MPELEPNVASIEAFRNDFSPRTWTRVVPLILGTILAKARRTVIAALRMVGLDHKTDFSKYQYVVNQ